MLEKLLSGYNADALPSNLVCVHIKSMGHNGAKDEIKMPEGPPAGSQTRILLVGIIYLPSLSQTAVADFFIKCQSVQNPIRNDTVTATQPKQQVEGKSKENICFFLSSWGRGRGGVLPPV